MTIADQLLQAALQLSILTYNIGVLVYLLPVPLRRLKRLAPLLIVDGLYSALIVGLFNVLLYASDYIGSISGYTALDALNIAKNMFERIILLFAQKKYYEYFLSLIPAGKFTIIATLMYLPVSLIYGTVVSASLALLTIIVSVLSLRAELAALGVLLYSIPLRLARSAGASLLAFVIVANAMIPFFPHWLGFIMGSVGYTVKDIVRYNETPYSIPTKVKYPFWGQVRDYNGDPPAYALVVLENQSHIILYQTNRRGYYAATNPAPDRGSYKIYLNYMGLNIYNYLLGDLIKVPEDLEPTYESSLLPYRLDLRYPPTVKFLDPQGVMLTDYLMLGEVKKGSVYEGYGFVRYTYTIKCPAFTSPRIHVVVALPSACRLEGFITHPINAASVSNSHMETVDWHGLQVNIFNIVIDINVSSPLLLNQGISIELSYSCPQGFRPHQPLGHPSIDPQNLYAMVLPMLPGSLFNVSISDVIAAGVAFGVSVFSYLTIMSLIIRDVSRALGAVSTAIVIEPR